MPAEIFKFNKKEDKNSGKMNQKIKTSAVGGGKWNQNENMYADMSKFNYFIFSHKPTLLGNLSIVRTFVSAE